MSSWGEYISDFGAKFANHIDDYGRFFSQQVDEDLLIYANTGANILTTMILNRYPIFGRPSFTNQGFRLSYDNVTITVALNLSEDYLILVSISFGSEIWKSFGLSIPDNLNDYRTDGNNFLDTVLTTISHIPFINTANTYYNMKVQINKMRKFIPADIQLDKETDVLTLVDTILSTSYSIDSL